MSGRHQKNICRQAQRLKESFGVADSLSIVATIPDIAFKTNTL